MIYFFLIAFISNSMNNLTDKGDVCVCLQRIILFDFCYILYLCFYKYSFKYNSFLCISCSAEKWRFLCWVIDCHFLLVRCLQSTVSNQGRPLQTERERPHGAGADGKPGQKCVIVWGVGVGWDFLEYTHFPSQHCCCCKATCSSSVYL